MLKRIHINQHKIKYNKKHNTNEPVITVKTSKSNDYGHQVDINGSSKLVYKPNKPLSCGAKVWIDRKGFWIVCHEDDLEKVIKERNENT